MTNLIANINIMHSDEFTCTFNVDDVPWHPKISVRVKRLSVLFVYSFVIDYIILENKLFKS
jgi:hypothetical protein